MGSGVVGATLGDKCRWRGLERVNGAVFGVSEGGNEYRFLFSLACFTESDYAGPVYGIKL